MLNLLGKSTARRDFGRLLERQLSTRARAPWFYAMLGVPDTIDGRFDMVALHGWLALARLKMDGLDEAAQDLTDTVFLGFDEALREQGTGDMGMGRRMKALADAFYGRLTVYSAASDRQSLAGALARNVWRGAGLDQRALALADYAWGARAALAGGDAANGVLDFGPLPGAA